MYFKHSLVVLASVLTPMFLAVPAADACTCGREQTPLEQYEWAHNAVIAQVVSFEKALESERAIDGIRSTRMIAEKVFKGSVRPNEEMIFAQGTGGDCIWTFDEKEIGERFLRQFCTNPI